MPLKVGELCPCHADTAGLRARVVAIIEPANRRFMCTPSQTAIGCASWHFYDEAAYILRQQGKRVNNEFGEVAP